MATPFPAALPVARTPDPRSAPTLRWGVLGTGWIADRFVASLQRHSSQQVVAAGSRSREGADAFARRHHLPVAHASYDALVADPSVDVVYVATPHTAHLQGALLALDAGKPVLVEKPLALTAAQGRQIAEAAAARGLFCLEAHWTTFLPKYDVVRQLLDGGALGEVTAVVADFGEWFPPGHRTFDPALAGGPVLDLGSYLVNLVVSVLGPDPDEIVARGSTLPGGITGQAGVLLRYGQRQAVLHTTLLANTPTGAAIAGTQAGIAIDGPFYQPGGFTLTSSDKTRVLRHDEPASAHEGGLHFQAAEVARQVTAGATETPLRPLSRSIETLVLLDEIRRQLDDRVPGETSA